MKWLLICLLSLSLLNPVAAYAKSDADVPTHEFLALMTFGGTQSGGDEAAFINSNGGVYYIDLEANAPYV